MVSADVAERGGRGLAEGGVPLRAPGGGLARLRARQLHTGEDGRGGGRGGRGGRQAGQPLRQRVHVHLDLRVVEVLLAVAVVRVAVTPVDDTPTQYSKFNLSTLALA